MWKLSKDANCDLLHQAKDRIAQTYGGGCSHERTLLRSYQGKNLGTAKFLAVLSLL
jgi:hypothetical protein